MNLGGMEAIAQQVAGKAILDHAKETEQKLVSLGLSNKRKPCREDPLCATAPSLRCQQRPARLRNTGPVEPAKPVLQNFWP